MVVTSTVANKMVKELNEQINLAKEIDEKSSIFLAAMGEDPETIRPEYNFIASSNKIANLENKVRSIKHSINKFNVTTKLEGFGNMTIDEALVFLPQLNDEKRRLTNMASRLHKQRKVNNSYSSSNIIDYEIANYDVELVKKELESTTKLISAIQTELNRINTTVKFEIPCD